MKIDVTSTKLEVVSSHVEDGELNVLVATKVSPEFRDDATALLERYGCNYYIKEDLRKAS